jgi:DNA-binding transcriptional MerR regulator
MAEESLSIALAVAKKFATSEDTLRYYEKIGLCHVASSAKRNPLLRPRMICARLEFIKCMRDAGVSLEALVIRYMKLCLGQGDSTIKNGRNSLG